MAMGSWFDPCLDVPPLELDTQKARRYDVLVSRAYLSDFEMVGCKDYTSTKIRILLLMHADDTYSQLMNVRELLV